MAKKTAEAAADETLEKAELQEAVFVVALDVTAA